MKASAVIASPGPARRGFRAKSLLAATTIAYFAVLGACLASPARWLVFIRTRSLNVPYTDEWAWADLLDRAHHGSIPWSVLWQSHNGHHEFFGSLLFLALDRYAGWSVPREQLINLLLGTCAVLLVYETLRRILDWRDAVVLSALSSLLLCGPLTYETMLIGYNMGWQICTASIAYVAWAFSAKRTTHAALAGAMVVVAVATFSSGQGLFIWPAGLIVLVARRDDAPRFAWAIWSAAALLCGVAYFAGTAGVVHSALAPGAGLRYFVTFMGVPLGWDGTSLRTVAIDGTAIVLVFAAGTAYLVRARQMALAAPLFAYGAYALLGALSTTVTRGGMGPLQATSPRYTAMSVFLIIAVLGEVFLIMRSEAKRGIVLSAAVSLVAIVMIAHVQSVAVSTVEVYEAARLHELRGIVREDPAIATDADTDPATLLRLLDQLRSMDDGPIRYEGGVRSAGSGSHQH